MSTVIVILMFLIASVTVYGMYEKSFNKLS